MNDYADRVNAFLSCGMVPWMGTWTGRGREGEEKKRGRQGRQSPVQRSLDRIGHRRESWRESNAEHVFFSNF